VWHSPKILVVDDEVRICESFAYLLAARNYDVDTATCGHDALSLLEDKRFDLAVLDVHLPDMMGTGVMEKVKLKSPDTVVIIITGDADLDSALTALKFGAYDYLRKPFEVEELLKTVENALNQRKLKREKDQINAKLCLSEQKYRYLVQNSPDLIYTLDHKGNFTFLSSTVEHFLGFTAEELIGKHYSTIVCEEDLGKAQWFFDERRSRERATSGIELRLKVAGGAIRKNGGSRFLPVELKSMGIHEVSKCEGDRRHVGTHGVIRDISERQRLQVQLQNAERMESLGTLAGGIAHDFNNLLMGIQGRTSLISMDLDAPHPHMEHLRAIDEYIRSATDLTKQLLGFARGGKYEVKPTDINGLIFKSLNMFARAKKEIIVETKFSNANIIAEIDRGQIEQVMLNLYVNAWQAMPEGGTLRLTTEAVVLDQAFCSPNQLSPGAYARVAVTDTGVGMDHGYPTPDFRSRVRPEIGKLGRDQGLRKILPQAYGCNEEDKIFRITQISGKLAIYGWFHCTLHSFGKRSLFRRIGDSVFDLSIGVLSKKEPLLIADRQSVARQIDANAGHFCDDRPRGTFGNDDRLPRNAIGLGNFCDASRLGLSG
jgi:two-component system cell cycle sensor histidine kinase/response regulator CckA